MGQMQTSPQKPPTELTDLLNRVLIDGGPGNIIVMEDKRTGYYVQIAASKGETWMHLEAVSNEYLDPNRRLDDRQTQMLVRLGWNRPGGDLKNFSQDKQAATEQQRQDIMAMIIATFEEAYRVSFGNVEITVTLD